MIYNAMIQGSADDETETFFRGGGCPAQWKAFERGAARKLDMVDAAVKLNDLTSAPETGWRH